MLAARAGAKEAAREAARVKALASRRPRNKQGLSASFSYPMQDRPRKSGSSGGSTITIKSGGKPIRFGSTIPGSTIDFSSEGSSEFSDEEVRFNFYYPQNTRI